MKKCGLVIRVSSEEQAANKEGSMTNQLQRLQDFIAYKNSAHDEDWIEAERYELRGISGKDSFRSPEFARLFADIKAGRVNVVVCTALDRICRSVKDFLNFFEILQEYNTEFVCLKQDYDTTSSQGRFFILIMMALAEFEREQTAERNKAAYRARAKRGLWNGGHILGYDLDPNRKGNIVPSKKEAVVVNAAFDIYLQCGSLNITARQMNERGYRTKETTSRRGKAHPAKEFCPSSINQIVSNYGYIGRKEINKGNIFKDQSTLPEEERYFIVDACWEPIVDEEKFFAVQALMDNNVKVKGNSARVVRHNYVLNGGLLYCEKCGSLMEGRSGTGSKGARYYYYACKQKACGFRVSSDEVEQKVLGHIRNLATHEGTLAKLVDGANQMLQNDYPRLIEQREVLSKEIRGINDLADGLLSNLSGFGSTDGSSFVKKKLDDLGKRKKGLETCLIEVDGVITRLEKDLVDHEAILSALKQFDSVFDSLKPYQQKNMIKLVLNKVVVSDESIDVALYGQLSGNAVESVLTSDDVRSERIDWLLE